MDWIKKNPAQLSLAIVALLAIAVMALLYSKVSAFDANFESARSISASTTRVEKLKTEEIDAARKALETPAAWQPGEDAGRQFISDLYVIKDGRLQKPGDGMFHPPVANKWLDQHGLDLLSESVLKEDPDQDGFTTLEEWNGLDTISHLDNAGQKVADSGGQPLPLDSTNPTDPKVHPPYHTKLELVKIVYIPFRLRFMSYDEDPKKPDETTVQINTVDRGNKTLYLKIGADIPNTKFKIDSFKKLEIPGPDGTKKDATELTVVNKETGAKVVLPLGQVVDSPDSYAVFRYKWMQPGGKPTEDFPKARGQTFTLPPEPEKTYKLIEIRGQDADIELPDGAKKILTAPR
jgi:hypothetical protein